MYNGNVQQLIKNYPFLKIIELVSIIYEREIGHCVNIFLF